MSELNGKRAAVIISHMRLARTVTLNCYPANLLDREDAISEGYYALIRACDSYNPKRGASLKHWITSYVRWHLINYVKGQKIYRRLGPGGKVMIDLPLRLSLTDLTIANEVYNIPDTRYAFREDVISFNFQFQLLKDKTKELMRRHYVDGVTLKTLAGEEGVTKQAIYGRLKYAVNKIQRAMI